MSSIRRGKRTVNRRTARTKSKKRTGNKLNSEERMVAGRDSIVVRQPGFVIPNQTISNMHFWAMQTHSNNGIAYTNVRYTPNNAYDVDPLVGSTAIAGLTEMAAFYSGMRVIKYRYDIDISNNEAFPVTVYCVPILIPGTDPGADTISGLDYPMNPLSKTFVLSAKGGQDRCKFKGVVDLPKLYTKQVLTDDNYAQSTAATLAAGFRIYIVLGGLAGSTTFTAAGITYSSHFYLETVFYNRKELLT